jgi:serine/threonine-protein kinase
LKTLLRSGLLSLEVLVEALAGYTREQLETMAPIHVAALLVRKKLLTKFQAMQLLQGRSGGFLLGAYKILEGIRQDRVGMVFLGENTETQQRVSVKVIPTDRVSDKAAFATFLKEVRTAAGVNHSTIAQILDIGVLTGTHYVISELVEAPTLDQVVAEEGPLSPQAAIQIVAQVALGLKQAHAVGLLHRDIKPQNIAVLPNRRVKLLDLGLTNLLDDPWQQKTKRINMDEYANEIAHIPPEQAVMTELDARSDLYSLGSTIYTALTGKAAFPGLAMESMAARQSQDIPLPSLIRPDLPAYIDALVKKLGARDPNARIASAADVVTMVYPHLPAAEWKALGVHIAHASIKSPSTTSVIRPRVLEEKAAKIDSSERKLFSSIRRLFSR